MGVLLFLAYRMAFAPKQDDTQKTGVTDRTQVKGGLFSAAIGVFAGFLGELRLVEPVGELLDGQPFFAGRPFDGDRVPGEEFVRIRQLKQFGNDQEFRDAQVAEAQRDFGTGGKPLGGEPVLLHPAEQVFVGEVAERFDRAGGEERVELY